MYLALVPELLELHASLQESIIVLEISLVTCIVYRVITRSISSTWCLVYFCLSSPKDLKATLSSTFQSPGAFLVPVLNLLSFNKSYVFGFPKRKYPSLCPFPSGNASHLGLYVLSVSKFSLPIPAAVGQPNVRRYLARVQLPM